jgi:hypothetical protein
MSKRIAYLFDACAGVGIGHYARVRAMRYWLNQVFGDDSVIIGWGDATGRLSPLVEASTQFAGGAEMFSHLSAFSPDVVVVDSYDGEQLQAVVEQFHVPVKLAFAEAFATQWVNGFDVLLDPTLVAVGSGRPEKFITGVDAVLLNKENYIHQDGSKDYLGGVFFNCGKSEMAARLLVQLRSDDSFGRGLDVKPGSGFGVFSVAKRANISVGDLNRHAAQVVVAAGQALWEAALNRESFYLAALTPSHADLLERLARHGVLRLRPAPELSDAEFAVYHCAPTPATRQRLSDPETSARNIAQAILTGHAAGC